MTSQDRKKARNKQNPMKKNVKKEIRKMNTNNDRKIKRATRGKLA